MREMYSRVVGAETWKPAALSETIIRHQDNEGPGIGAAMPRPVGRAGRRDRQMRLAFARLANWPQTLVRTPDQIGDLSTRKTEVSQTRRWREMDSNFRFRCVRRS
jgi:hypothetical protein